MGAKPQVCHQSLPSNLTSHGTTEACSVWRVMVMVKESHGQAPEADQSTGRVKAGYIIQMCRNKGVNQSIGLLGICQGESGQILLT